MIIPKLARLSCLTLFLFLGLHACGGEDQGSDQVVSVPGVVLEAGALEALGATASARGLDLLVITLDTVRADRLGCAGYARAETPAIDRLASTGVRFEHAIAAAPITLPSHASLFTGLNPLSHGVRNNGTFSLAAEHQTLAESLSAGGYLTGAFVGAYVLDARYGLAQGFDHYDDRVNPSGSGRRSGHFNERSAAQVTDAALRWMKSELPKSAERPLFTWVHYFDAHHPYEPPGEFGSRFRSNPYDGEIAYMDSQIARLVEYLESVGRAERTLIVITSDHGEGLGEHSEETHSRLLYDSTLRVPLILSCPLLFPEPVVVRDRVVGLVDLVPTILDLLGIAGVEGIDGVHLFKAPVDLERSVYVETLVPLFNHGWAPLQGLHRLGDKFISAPRPEFYDVSNDPAENYNLYPESPPAAGVLEERLALELEGQGSAFELRDTEKGMDPEQAKRLAALGYTRTGSGSGPIGVLDPKDMMPLFKVMMEARSLTDAGRHLEAEQKNDVILAQNPGDAFAWETESLIFVRTGRHAEAESALQRMLKIQPTAEGYVRLAQLQLQRKDLAAMQNTLGLAEALDPREGGVHMVAGDAYASVGRFSEARGAFEMALKLDPVKWGAMAQEKLRMLQGR
jgi:choline-sulfatase